MQTDRQCSLTIWWTEKKKSSAQEILFDFLPAHSKHIAPALRDSHKELSHPSALPC